MQAYRDQYASLFRGGQDVVLIGISNDTPEDLHSWMKDDDFQFLFASDNSGQTYQAFGGNLRASQAADRRSVIVIGPDGRIAHVIPAFLQTDPAAYEELAAAIDRVTPQP
jgi:peroxiredoxin Q/BCP